ncbi:hypothetical protein ACUR5C_00255 [Aliikangiella sp. IMCC44653]
MNLCIRILVAIFALSSNVVLACSTPKGGWVPIDIEVEFLGECFSHYCEKEKSYMKLRADIPKPNCLAEVYFEGKQIIVIIPDVTCENVPARFTAETTEKYCYEPRYFGIKNHNQSKQKDAD